MTAQLSTQDEIIQPALRLPELEELLTQSVAAKVRQEVPKKVRRIRFILWLAYFGKQPHKNPNLKCCPASMSQYIYLAMAISFSGKLLQKDLGGTANTYGKYLEEFFIYPPGRKGSNKWKRITKPYHLRDEITHTLDRIWRDSTNAIPYDKNAGEKLRRDQLPKNGVRGERFSSITVPSFIPFAISRLDDMVQQQESRVAAIRSASGLSFPQYRTETYRLRDLYQIRLWVRQFGGVPNFYKEARHGRLTGTGQVNLQAMSQSIRQELFAGSGYWDYDFAGCHYYITQALCRTHKIHTPALDDYLLNKKENERFLTDEFEIPQHSRKIKELMLAILNGQVISSSPYVSLRRSFSEETIRAIQQNPFIKEIKQELKHVRPAIIKGYKHNGQVHNVVGKTRPLRYHDKETGEPKKTSTGSLFSHILFGYEAWALDTILSNNDDVLVLVFDGWISTKKQDIVKMEQKILSSSIADFGFPLPLKIKGAQF